MVGDHPVVHIARPVRVCRCHIRAGLDQRAHQVGVVIVMLALQQRADPFQPHAGIDRLHVQRLHRAIFELLVLHEDDVPDLDEPVAILFRATRRATPDVIAVIIENLGAGTTGPGRPHLPEIVGCGDADDPVLGNADLFPDLERLVIGVVNRGIKPFGINIEIARDQFIGEGDRLFLEIVAKAEIPQHFKEGMVPRGIAHIVQIVMLAPGTHAFLRGGGALVVAGLDPGEQVLELHHAGIGEHQRRVIARHQRAGGHDLMAVARKIIEKGRADIVQRGHGRLLVSGAAWRVGSAAIAAGLNPPLRTVHRANAQTETGGRRRRPPFQSILSRASATGGFLRSPSATDVRLPSRRHRLRPACPAFQNPAHGRRGSCPRPPARCAYFP